MITASSAAWWICVTHLFCIFVKIVKFTNSNTGFPLGVYLGLLAVEVYIFHLLHKATHGLRKADGAQAFISFMTILCGVIFHYILTKQLAVGTPIPNSQSTCYKDPN